MVTGPKGLESHPVGHHRRRGFFTILLTGGKASWQKLPGEVTTFLIAAFLLSRIILAAGNG